MANWFTTTDYRYQSDVLFHVLGMLAGNMSSFSYPRPLPILRQSQSYPSHLTSLHNSRASTTVLQFSPTAQAPLRYSRPPSTTLPAGATLTQPTDLSQPVYRRNIKDESSSSRDESTPLEADDHGALNLSARSNRSSQSTDSSAKSPPITSQNNWYAFFLTNPWCFIETAVCII